MLFLCKILKGSNKKVLHPPLELRASFRFPRFSVCGTNLRACAARARLYHLPCKMATFNAKAFEKKLNGMDLSQTSVQTVSLWIIHHKQNIKEVIGVWVDMMKKGNVWEIHQSIWHVTKETDELMRSRERGSYRGGSRLFASQVFPSFIAKFRDQTPCIQANLFKPLKDDETDATNNDGILK